MSKLDDRLKNLTGASDDDLKKPTRVRPPYVRKGGHGGKRKGTGGSLPRSDRAAVNRGRREVAEGHFDGTLRVQVTDPKTGKVMKIDKPRMLIILDELFTAAVKDHNVQAMMGYLNRALGMPKQPVTGGDEGDEPIKTEIVGLETILDKAYPDGDDND